MTEEMILSLSRETIFTTLLVAGPILAMALITGLFISIIQAITQINEATLTFIPKILAIVLTVLIMSPWMTEVMTNYTRELIISVPDRVR